jgi:hypothetical protein
VRHDVIGFTELLAWGQDEGQKHPNRNGGNRRAECRSFADWYQVLRVRLRDGTRLWRVSSALGASAPVDQARTIVSMP